MANKRINELALRTPQTTDLMLIGDPTTGYSYKTTLLSALNLGVPTTRTITINGTTFDLSANRSWSVGTVTSVGLTMPAAFNVASSPVTGSGTIAVTAAGLASQYIRGDGSLADFPGGGGGGGASVSYYLNGSVNQGTLGGVTYYEMNKTPILGAGTNFTTSSNGYIASFLTDAGDPALLKIPGGNWNTEFYFAASSGGGTPTYYLELYKYDGTTFTLIASNSSNPDAITGGTSIEQYFTTLAVPETVLTATDRLAIRIYVTTAGRTITLHTENSNLCQIITTFTTGLTALNGLTAQVQYFATGSAGTDFNISSSTATHTFNIPTASATNRGLLSTADWTTFNNKVPYTGATANVDLGIYNLSAKSVFIEGTASYQSGLAMKQLNSFDFVSGEYTQIAPSSTTELNLVYNQSGGARRRAALSAAVLQNGDNFQYLFPRQNGTFAMLTDISTAINGTTNWIPRFTSANTIGLSNLYDGSSFIGVFTATDNLSGAKLQVNGAATFTGKVSINTAGNGELAVFGLNSTSDKYITLKNSDGDLYLGTSSTSNYLWGVANLPLLFYTNNLERMRISASGNLGLGVTPSAWGSYRAYQVGWGSIASYDGADTAIFSNVYFDGGTWRYVGTGNASQYRQLNSVHSWHTAPSGTAGNAITFTQAMTLDASGRLGIGTATPAERLHVAGAIISTGGITGHGANRTTLSQEGANGAFWQSYGANTSTMGAFVFRQASSDFSVVNTAMTITSSGNVGIGTATPSYKLDIYDASGTSIVVGAATGKTYVYGDDAGGTIGTISSIPLRFSPNNTERLRITSSGRILIGTTTDNTVDLLQVAGSGRFTKNGEGLRLQSADANGNYITFHNGSAAYGYVGSNYYLIGSGSASDLGILSQSNIVFSAGGATERMRITSGGYSKFSNNGVYTGASSNYHEFYQTANIVGCFFRCTNGSFTSTLIEGQADRTTTNTSYYLFDVYNGNVSGRFRIADSGNATNTNGSYGTISDISLKENIVDATPKLLDILKLKVKNFNLKSDESKLKQIGFIAQEFEEVFPGMIDIDQQTGLKAIKTSVLVPMLVKAIQEQQIQIEDLKSKLN